MGGCHYAALLDGVVEQGKRSGRAVAAAAFQTHFLKDMRHGVAYRRGRGKRKIDNAERYAEPAGGFARNELTHACDLEGRPLYQIGNGGQIAVARLGESRSDNSGAGYADVYNAVRLARAVECTRHKRVILRGVAKHHQLCGADAVPVGGQLRAAAHHPAHHCDGIHIDARLGRAYVDRGADMLRHAQRLGDSLDKLPVAGGKALLLLQLLKQLHPVLPGGVQV